jgi:hypothetical protein
MRRGALLMPALSLLAAGVWLFSSPAHAYWFLHQNFSLDPAVSAEEYRAAPDGSRPSPGNMPGPIEMEMLPLPTGVSGDVAGAAMRAVENWSRVSGSGLTIELKAPPAGGGGGV